MSKIYVGNVPFDHDPRDFEEAFAKFGRILTLAAKRGFAFIHYDDPRDAEAAVEAMEGREWNGRRLRVAMSTSATSTGGGGDHPQYQQQQQQPPHHHHHHHHHPHPRMPDRSVTSRENAPASRNLFVANIAPDVKLSELEAFFEQFGPIKNVKVLPQARGNVAMSAFVDFEDVAAAEKAHTSELILADRRLRTDYNHPREPRRTDGDQHHHHHQHPAHQQQQQQHEPAAYVDPLDRRLDTPRDNGRGPYRGNRDAYASRRSDGDRRSRSREKHRGGYGSPTTSGTEPTRERWRSPARSEWKPRTSSYRDSPGGGGSSHRATPHREYHPRESPPRSLRRGPSPPTYRREASPPPPPSSSSSRRRSRSPFGRGRSRSRSPPRPQHRRPY